MPAEGGAPDRKESLRGVGGRFGGDLQRHLVADHRGVGAHTGVGRYGRWARRHHFHHHFVDPKTNHGVTTPLWDLVFRTYRTPEVIPVPAKLCMRWLLDDAGAVRAEHADRYQLRGARS